MKISIGSRIHLTPLLAAHNLRTLTKKSNRETATLRSRISDQVTIFYLLMTSLLAFNNSIQVIQWLMKELCLRETRAHNLSQILREQEILTICYWWARIHSSNRRNRSNKINNHSSPSLILTIWQIWIQTECLPLSKQIPIWWHLKLCNLIPMPTCSRCFSPPFLSSNKQCSTLLNLLRQPIQTSTIPTKHKTCMWNTWSKKSQASKSIPKPSITSRDRGNNSSRNKRQTVDCSKT